jgi:hypothetical protein
MSNASSSAETDPTKSLEESKPSSSRPSENILLVSYPKIVFLYPTLLAALFCGLIALFRTDETTSAIVATIFLSVMSVNLVVFGFDFPRATSLTLFFFLAAIALGVVLFLQFKPEILPLVTEFMLKYRPVANATFYLTIGGVLGMIFLIVRIFTRFDYWEVRNNELIHHHGMLADLKRYSAPHLKVEKEITDVFEYCLLKSGRLILQPRDEQRAIILENVPFIEKKEAALMRLLSALQVEVRKD